MVNDLTGQPVRSLTGPLPTHTHSDRLITRPFILLLQVVSLFPHVY